MPFTQELINPVHIRLSHLHNQPLTLWETEFCFPIQPGLGAEKSETTPVTKLTLLIRANPELLLAILCLENNTVSVPCFSCTS